VTPVLNKQPMGCEAELTAQLCKYFPHRPVTQ